jgi:hypothetical protein
MLHSTNGRNLECYLIDKEKLEKLFKSSFMSCAFGVISFLCIRAETETHTKAQATRHGCLSSLLVGGDKVIEIVYVEE